jgi:hypothetical protein
MHRFFSPVMVCKWRAIFRTISSVTTWMDRAMSISRWVISDSAARAGPPKEIAKLVVGHGQPAM